MIGISGGSSDLTMTSTWMSSHIQMNLRTAPELVLIERQPGLPLDLNSYVHCGWTPLEQRTQCFMPSLMPTPAC